MIYVRCESCGSDIGLTSETCELTLYTKEPWLNSCRITCPYCPFVLNLFADPEAVGELMELGFAPHLDERGSEELTAGWESLHAEEFAHFHETIERATADDFQLGGHS